MSDGGLGSGKGKGKGKGTLRDRKTGRVARR
jgi:hypothetical protein